MDLKPPVGGHCFNVSLPRTIHAMTLLLSHLCRDPARFGHHTIPNADD
jgi:hypothetical protein